MKDITYTLYHGSRDGLNGDIIPESNSLSDFGSAFYMGSNPYQVQSSSINGSIPTFYIGLYDFTKLDKNKILVLDGDIWLYAIIAYKNLDKEFAKSEFATTLVKNLNKFDLLIGDIADDNMFSVFNGFSYYGSITNIAVLKCFTMIKLGKQFAAKSKYACSLFKIVGKHILTEDEISICKKKYAKLKVNIEKRVRKIFFETSDGLTFNKFIDVMHKPNLANDLICKQQDKTPALLDEILANDITRIF